MIRLGLGGELVVCGELVVGGEYYNLEEIDRSVVVVLSPPPLYFGLENSENTRNELALPVMGTIFLVVLVKTSLFHNKEQVTALTWARYW